MTIVAIDGPSGSGKSTVARTVALRLDLPYLDTGAMYRAVALVAIAQGISFDDAVKLEIVAAEVKLEFADDRSGDELRQQVMVNGADETTSIRTPEVSQGASAIAVHPPVRERLVRRQRNWVNNRGGGVVEGRDIGTVVFPEADLKVFLTASDKERAKRRIADADAPGFSEMSHEKAHEEIVTRDRRDSTRDTSPLAAADDAITVHTDGKDIEEVVLEVLGLLHARKSGSAT